MTLTQNLTGTRLTLAEVFESLLVRPAPIRFTAYDGSSYGPEDAQVGLNLKNERGLAYLVTAPGDLGLARAYVSGDLDVVGVHPGDPYEAMVLLLRAMRFRRPWPTCARPPLRRRSTCRAGVGWWRASGTRPSGTARSSSTTTTSPTGSTSWCSGRR